MRFLISLVLGLSVCVASAQSISDYVKLRRQHYITMPTSSQALDNIVGDKIVEIQGKVQGSFKSGDITSLIVQRDDDQTQRVDCKVNPPEWLCNGEVAARLMVHVNRAAQFEPLSAELVAAAPESDISKVDDAYWRHEAAVAKNKAASNKPRPGGYTASRGDSSLYGPIGGYRSHRVSARFNSSPETVAAYAAFIKKRNPRLSDDKTHEIAEAIIGYSTAYKFDPRLVVAVLLVESDFDPNSTSRTGAMGLGQLMPGTASWMGVHNAYDTTDNLYGTIKLLRTNLEKYGARVYKNNEIVADQGLSLALAAYNAGDGAVARHHGVPPYRETQAYVARVTEYYRELCGSN